MPNEGRGGREEGKRRGGEEGGRGGEEGGEEGGRGGEEGGEEGGGGERRGKTNGSSSYLHNPPKNPLIHTYQEKQHQNQQKPLPWFFQD